MYKLFFIAMGFLNFVGSHIVNATDNLPLEPEHERLKTPGNISNIQEKENREKILLRKQHIQRQKERNLRLAYKRLGLNEKPLIENKQRRK